jgi:hypothetical protein
MNKWLFKSNNVMYFQIKNISFLLKAYLCIMAETDLLDLTIGSEIIFLDQK